MPYLGRSLTLEERRHVSDLAPEGRRAHVVVLRGLFRSFGGRQAVQDVGVPMSLADTGDIRTHLYILSATDQELAEVQTYSVLHVTPFVSLPPRRRQ